MRYKDLFPDDKSKADAFDKIAVQCFAGNFGKMTKVDYETLLFRLYLNQNIQLNADNVTAYSDFRLSKELGITQARVRSLRMQKELRYPGENPDWRKVFADCVKNARYDEVKHLVKMSVPDVTVLTELRHFVEEHGWYDEYQLNPKLFQCRLDIFIEICTHLEKETGYHLDDVAKKQLLELKDEVGNDKEKTAIDKILSGSIEDGVKEFLISAEKEGAICLLKALPFGGLAATAIQFLIAALSK